ncbi:MAG: glycoside hydrolase family 3 N-terminal domain-containing protein [bacterium]
MKSYKPAVCFLISLSLFVPVRALAQTDIGALLGQMTLEEKASLVTGQNGWETRAISRLGIPAAWMADGPVGLRKSKGLDPTQNVPATAFPSAAALSATWNPHLIERVGAGIGAEARNQDVVLLLGPGLNLKRHPLGGRNFEYYSEDPLLSGKIAAAFVRGVQSQGVGATLKHFAVNNQEYRRMVIDARVGARALHELYLRGFEIAVKEGRPQAVMSAYNRVNGVSASASSFFLTDILRGQWGFDGLVVSDWGAVNDPVASLAAGLDLEMPGNPLTPPQVVQAVQDGRLPEEKLDRAVAHVLQLARRRNALRSQSKTDVEKVNHDLAREVAVESMVLLENDGILPLQAGAHRRIGVLGRLATRPRFEGIGSAQVTPTRVDTPWSSIAEIGTRNGHVLALWNGDYAEDGLTERQRSDVLRFLSEQDAALLFVGQKASTDAEAWDRPSSRLAPGDLNLLDAARASGKPFAVVVIAGGSVDLKHATAGASAVLMGWLGGQAFGSAVAQVLFGERTPSGRLSETFALSTNDHVSSLNFPGGPWEVTYAEGLYVGYRYFQSFDQEVAYPFGHGLSYTEFEYLRAQAPDTVNDVAGGLDVQVAVRNAGDRNGAETVQVYLRHLHPTLDRPDRELAGFQKAAIAPGAIRRFSIHLDGDRFAYFHDGLERWVVESGDYELLIGASAGDIRFTLPLHVKTGTMPAVVYTLDHTLGDLYRDERGRIVVDFLFAQSDRPRLSEADKYDFMAAIMRNLPFRKLANFSGGKLTLAELKHLLSLINSDMEPGALRKTLQTGWVNKK